MHNFTGVWITDEKFADFVPRDRYYQHSVPMLQKMAAKDPEHNAHVLFRKAVTVKAFQKATIYISADDYYKLYINGEYVAMGPTPCYPWAYNYTKLDVTKFLKKGKNVIAVHTYYQGLVNRYWVSGDLNHGLLMDVVVDGKTVCASDETFLTARHTGYSISGTYGYDTGYTENYDARAKESDFARPDFDDSDWKKAKKRRHITYQMTPQVAKPVTLEWIEPVSVKTTSLPGGKKRVLADFGELRVGYLALTVRGKSGSVVTLKSAQELDENGAAMYVLLTTNVQYLEKWTLRDGESTLDQFDYKVFRYAEIDLPRGCEIVDLGYIARHYPFRKGAHLRASLQKACKDEKSLKELRSIWDLCVNTMRLGPQDTMHDCMDRERGSYLADVGLAAATHAVVTGDVSLLRGFIEDAFNQIPIIDTLGAGNCCALIQLIAEYPLIFLRLPWFCYCISGDKKMLAKDFERVCKVLDATKRDYEVDGLYGPVDKWCVVEWPKEYRGGYDADLSAKKGIQPDTHIVMNMHYLKAIHMANVMAKELGVPAYRDEREVGDAIIRTMYDKKRHLFRDSIVSKHTCYIGNLFPLAFDLIPDEQYRANMEKMIIKNMVSTVNEFGPYPILEYFTKKGDEETLVKMLLDRGAWLHMIESGANVSWEAWGKDCKWNTSLFHNSLAYAAIYMSDIDLKKFLA